MRLGKASFSALVLCLSVVIIASVAVTIRNVIMSDWTADNVVVAADFQPVVSDIEPEEGQPEHRHHIEWLFTAYTEPDFTADQVASFHPQAVTILYEGADGWAQIYTAYGDAWVYLPGNLLYLRRVVGLFEEAPLDGYATGSHIDVITPQLVRVLDQDGYWLQIESWLGPMWVDLNFKPPTTELDAIISRFGNNVSVFYENLETGFI